MRRWFLSYNSQDLALAQAVEAALRRNDADGHVFFAPKSLRAGGYWMPELAKEIGEATVFVLLIGESGLGAWQRDEYLEAYDRRVKEAKFPLVLVLLDGKPAPGLPFLKQLHWIVTAEPATDHTIAGLIAAADGAAGTPSNVWRHTAPYRGLEAMTAADSAFFFGRTEETVRVLRVLASSTHRLPILLGNSGVGKSSLAQAGVVATLGRQAWPDGAKDPGPWPVSFANSRRWCFMNIRPGTEPVRALVEAFLDTWQFEGGDPTRVVRRNDWVDLLLDAKGKVTLSDLMDETTRRDKELNRPPPEAYFLYVDQGEELYIRADVHHRARFSDLLARGISDSRLRALMSIRSDFLGELQRDQSLFAVRHQIDVPPMREPQLLDVVGRPSALLGVRFETARLAATIARKAAEESANDSGTLPLLSYLLDDMWRQMLERNDGVLRLPERVLELGAVLVHRADAFLAKHPDSEEMLRRIFTLKLATIHGEGDPTRRRAARSEFSDKEWTLVTELADQPNRLLVVATPENGDTYAELAHEAIFRHWDKLRQWTEREREFLAWRHGLESARRAWEKTKGRARKDALLMGLPLRDARAWCARRSDDLWKADRDFIVRSFKHQRLTRARDIGLAIVLPVLAVLVTIGLIERDYLTTKWQFMIGPAALTVAQESALTPGQEFSDCAHCPVMVVLRPGEFLRPNGRATQKVTIGYPLAVSHAEVTFAEWEACVAMRWCTTESNQGWGEGMRPIINITFAETQRYIAWIRQQTGKDYRLLSEAEWQYAALAGRTWKEAAYVVPKDGKPTAQCRGCAPIWDERTVPVDAFAKNSFGLYGVNGNVWEWVEDCWHDTYDGAPMNGDAWVATRCSDRVLLGGSWKTGPDKLGLAGRYDAYAADRDSDVGFRIARTLAPQ